jgi:glycosyltransferase 2 family protein
MTNAIDQTTPPHPRPLPEGEGGRRSRKWIFSAIKWTLFSVTLFFVAHSLARQLRGFDWRNFHPSLGFVLCTAGCIALVTVTQIIAYRLLLAAYGPKLTWPQAATLSWVPGLAKYIPGKVVAIGGTVYLLRRYKISAPIALSVTLMGDAVAVLTGLIVGAPLLLTPQARERLPGAWIWCPVLIVIALICLYPPVFARLVNLALRKLKREPLNAVPKLSYYILPILAGFAQWVCWGLAMWFMSRSITAIGWNVLPRFIVIAAISNTIGYLAFFTNGGIGVREWFLALGLNPIIGPANAAIVVIAVRILQTLVELVLAGIGMIVLRQISSMASET